MIFSRMNPPLKAVSSSLLMESMALAMASGVLCFGGTVASCPICKWVVSYLGPMGHHDGPKGQKPKRKRKAEMGDEVYVYLGGEHSEVPLRTASGEVFTACGFDVGARVGDAHDLNERDLNWERRGNEDGVHWVI